MKINSFEDLDCWQEARLLVKHVYEVTRQKDFSKDLRFSGQIQAAAISAMANIAEGFTRRSDKEFIQFLYIAMASTAEVQSHLYVALDQAYIAKDQFDKIYKHAEKTGKMVSNLIKYLRNAPTR
jgi:four helix bundle protein